MEHIKNEFGRLIQYVCISSPRDIETSSSSSSSSSTTTIYIQINLHQRVNKKTYFFQSIAGISEKDAEYDVLIATEICILLGMQCNYRVTTDDRAWNSFLKRG